MTTTLLQMFPDQPSPADDSARLDTLLALAIAFSMPPETACETTEDETDADEGLPEESPGVSPLDLLTGVAASDQRELEQKLAALQVSTRAEQANWVARTLGRVIAVRSTESARLDESVHVTQVIEALRAEPPRVQALIARNLPGRVGGVAAEDGVCLDTDFEKQSSDSPKLDGPLTGAPQGEIVSVVRRAFLSNFSKVDDLTDPTSLDSLTPIELARLVRLLGVHETAVACRSIAEVETVASFLSRFAAEDSRAIALSMLTIEGLEPARADFAERTVQSAIADGLEGAAALDRMGVALLAIELDGWEPARLRYTEQKLPVEAARSLTRFIADRSALPDNPTARRIALDIEKMAEKVRSQSGSDGAEPQRDVSAPGTGHARVAAGAPVQAV
jgi:hypothetical protein